MPLETRHKEIKKNVKSNKKIGLIVILIIVGFIVAVMIESNSNYDACDCANLWGKTGGGIAATSSQKNEVWRCESKYGSYGEMKYQCDN